MNNFKIGLGVGFLAGGVLLFILVGLGTEGAVSITDVWFGVLLWLSGAILIAGAKST